MIGLMLCGSKKLDAALWMNNPSKPPKLGTNIVSNLLFSKYLKNVDQRSSCALFKSSLIKFSLTMKILLPSLDVTDIKIGI